MLLTGFASVFTVEIILFIFIGVVLGIIFGSIPGMTVTMGVALFLPITFGMDPITGISLLIALYIGGTSGGLLSAVLLKIPGTPASIATTFDGSPMAERGEAGKALGVGIVFSFIGGLFSALILVFVSPILADIALKFGFYEYFAIAVFSLTMISSLSAGSTVKGLVSGIMGMAFALVGTAPITAFPRFTFGFHELDAGFSLLPALIGLFGVSQVIEYAGTDKSSIKPIVSDYKIRGFGFSIAEFISQIPNALRSGLIGTGIGILPGLGAGVCNIISYGSAKKNSKYPEKFGTGIIDGIVASETSNNASTGGALVPLLTLGIPGDNTTAILLSGLMIHGITPGPLLFATDAKLVYGIFAALILANIFMIIVEFVGIRVFVKLLTVPKHILLPVVVAFCAVGSFGLNNRMFDVWTMLVFGFIGYLMTKFHFPKAPIILGFILGPIVEINLRRGLMKSQGSFVPFFTEPISALFIVITLIVIIMNVIGEVKKAQARKLSMTK